MAFDLYVGPASRYQAGNWKTTAQQHAEAEGLPVPPARKKASVFAFLFTPEPKLAYRAWRKAIETAIKDEGLQESLWNDNPNQPYLVDRLGIDGQIGLVQKYAYLRRPELKAPMHLLSPEDLQKDPALRAPSPEAFDGVKLLNQCETFVPGSFQATVVAQDLRGARVEITTLKRLDRALRQMCELWGKDRAEMGSMVTDPPDRRSTLNDAAIHGLAVYCRMTDAAMAQNLPLFKDR